MNRRGFLATSAIVAGAATTSKAFPFPSLVDQVAAVRKELDKQGKVKVTSAAVSEKTKAFSFEEKEFFVDVTDKDGFSLTVDSSKISNEFFPFQGVGTGPKATLLPPSKVHATADTTSEKPDVKLSVVLQAFHLGVQERVKENTRATLLVTMNRDEQSPRGSTADTLYWAAATGMALWNGTKKQVALPNELTADLHRAFGNRMVEIPGGLGSIRIQVLKHKKESWWEKTFKFATGIGTTALTSSFGFPGVTAATLPFINELWDRILHSSPEVLFASRDMQIAFSKGAEKAIAADPFQKIGALNSGTWVLVRGKDFPALKKAGAYFDANLKMLVPNGVEQEDIITGRKQNPLDDITYLVIKADVRPTKLDI